MFNNAKERQYILEQCDVGHVGLNIDRTIWFQHALEGGFISIDCRII